MLLCKGLCDILGGNFRYRDGYNYCCICECFVQPENKHCPCCRCQVRAHKRAWGKDRDVEKVYY